MHKLTIGAVEADRVMSRMWGMPSLQRSLADAWIVRLCSTPTRPRPRRRKNRQPAESIIQVELAPGRAVEERGVLASQRGQRRLACPVLCGDSRPVAAGPQLAQEGEHLNLHAAQEQS
jgi:hypothetical protein